MTDSKNRLTAAIECLADLGLDALLINDEINVRYLCGFTGDSSSLLIQPERTTILSDGRFTTQIQIDCPDLNCVIRPPSQSLAELTRCVVADSGAGTVGIEANHLSLATFRLMEHGLDSVKLVETSGVIEAIRMVKDAEEIERTRESIRVAESAMEAILSSLSPADTEREIAYRIEAEVRSRGATGCSFPSIVAGGAAAALPHYIPGATRIGDADTLLIDWGAFVAGYASDLTRTFHRERATDRFRRAYDAVLAAQLAAIDKIAPGAATADVDRAAREVLDRAGIADAFVHSLGHGIGLQIHEGPRLSTSSDDTLAPGMIVTVEPGVYFQDDFGIRIEDDVLVTATGCEVLSRLPKGLDDCRLML